jgi:hypothetical protein
MVASMAQVMVQSMALIIWEQLIDIPDVDVIVIVIVIDIMVLVMGLVMVVDVNGDYVIIKTGL